MVAKKEGRRRWVQKVKTVSTFPPKTLFTKDAATICPGDGQQEGQSQGHRVGNPHGPVLPQSRRQEPARAAT